jgi:DNA-binding response OmpR family regulator
MGQSTPLRPVALVIEEDDDQRAMAATLLEEMELDVIECDTAEAALAAMETRATDRIAMAFVNVRLPGKMDGVEFAQIVKSEKPEVKVIVTSSRRSKRINDLPGGAVYMAKPWLPLELLICAEPARTSL